MKQSGFRSQSTYVWKKTLMSIANNPPPNIPPRIDISPVPVRELSCKMPKKISAFDSKNAYMYIWDMDGHHLLDMVFENIKLSVFEPLTV